MMGGTRIDLAIEALLERVVQAVPLGDWETVNQLSEAVLALDSANEDAETFRRMAQKMLGLSAVTAATAVVTSSSATPTAAVASEASPTPITPSPVLPVAATGPRPVAPIGSTVGVMPPPHAHSHAIDSILDSVQTLAPFSTIATRLIEMLDDEFSTLEEIAKLAGTDPVLTGRILRAANSAYYQRRVRVATIRDALVVLGAQEVRSIVVATCLVGSMPATNMVDHTAFWRFSLVVGLLADMISRTAGLLGGEAFTAGVTHNVGLLVLDQYCPQGLVEARDLVVEGRRRLHDREELIFGLTDAEVGARVATRWGLPAGVVRAIGRHGARIDEVPARDMPAAAVIRARIFARAQGLHDGIEQSEPRAESMGWLPPGVVSRLESLGGWEAFLARLDALLESAHG